jgi:carboxylate-amine ligase
MEREVQVLDGESLSLTPRAHEVIEYVATKKVKPEFFQSSLEVITGVCQTVQDVERDFVQTLDMVRQYER